MFDVIFDRDGILNVDVGYTYRIADFALPDGAIEALTLLREAGARFLIATGQSGIARGKYGQGDMEKFNEHLVKVYGASGISFAAIVSCPHHPDHSGDCDCRKPKPGMLQQIEQALGPIDWSQAWGIGDKPTDAEMILAMGGRSVLVENGPHNNTTGSVYWRKDDPTLADLLENPRNFVAASIGEAATLIRAHL